jgi:hypothetical protein
MTPHTGTDQLNASRYRPILDDIPAEGGTPSSAADGAVDRADERAPSDGSALSPESSEITSQSTAGCELERIRLDASPGVLVRQHS